MGYELNEKKGWSMDLAELKDAVLEARQRNLNVRGLVFINPGNPTGERSIDRSSLHARVPLCAAQPAGARGHARCGWTAWPPARAGGRVQACMRMHANTPRSL